MNKTTQESVVVPKIVIPKESGKGGKVSPNKKQEKGLLTGRTFSNLQKVSDAITCLWEMIVQIEECNKMQNSTELSSTLLPIICWLEGLSNIDIAITTKFKECVLKIQKSDWGKALCSDDLIFEHALKLADIVAKRKIDEAAAKSLKDGNDSSRSSESNASEDKKSKGEKQPDIIITKETPRRTPSILESIGSGGSLKSLFSASMKNLLGKDTAADPTLVTLFDNILASMDKKKLYPDTNQLMSVLIEYVKSNSVPKSEALNLALEKRSPLERVKIYFLIERTFRLGPCSVDYEKKELQKIVDELKVNTKEKDKAIFDKLEEKKKKLEGDIINKSNMNELAEKIVKMINLKEKVTNSMDKSAMEVNEFKVKVASAKKLGEDMDEIYNDGNTFAFFLDFLRMGHRQPDETLLLEYIFKHEKKTVELDTLTKDIVSAISKSEANFTTEDKKVEFPKDVFERIRSLFKKHKDKVLTTAKMNYVTGGSDDGDNIWSRSWNYYQALLQKNLPIPYKSSIKPK